MADNVPITAGSGTDIATDDVSAVHYQIVKLADGTLGSTALIGGDATNGLDVDVSRIVPGVGATNLGKAEDAGHSSGDTGVMALAVTRSAANSLSLLAGSADDYNPLQQDERGSLSVVHRPYATKIATTSASLTTASTAYSAGDQLGSEISLANAVRISGGSGVLTKLVLIDYSDVLGAVDAFLFNAASTPASDNAANSWSDANMDLLEGIVSLSVVADSANNRVLVWTGAMPFVCAATTLFVNLVTRTGHTFFGAAGDIHVKAHIVQD